MSSSILVIDIGSSSVRALLFDQTARLIPDAISRREYQFNEQATADPVHLRHLIEACIDDIIQHPKVTNIIAVGMDSFAGNMVGVSDTNKPLMPLYTYADKRGQQQLEHLKNLLDADAYHQRTGAFLHTAYYPTRLRWIADTHPAIFKQVHRWIDLGTYCYQTWFGHQVSASYSIMSWSGLLNRETADWDALTLNAIQINRQQVPTLADINDTQRGLQEAYRQRWPQLADVPFFNVVGDGAAANIGSGAISENQVALTVGTTAALRTITTQYSSTIPDGLWSYRVTKDRHLIGGATSEGGNIFAWAQDTLHLPDNAEELLANRVPDAHELTVLPIFNGERSPYFNPEAIGTIYGLTTTTSPLDIFQAALESVAIRLSIVFEQLEVPTVQVMASGGALYHSNIWPQMMANAFGVPIHVLDEPEITARGVALLILEELSAINIADYPPRILKTIHPDTDSVEIMAKARQRQDTLYAVLFE